MKPTERDVLLALSTGPKAARDLASALPERHPRSIEEARKALVEEGLVAREGEARATAYRITDKGQAALATPGETPGSDKATPGPRHRGSASSTPGEPPVPTPGGTPGGTPGEPPVEPPVLGGAKGEAGTPLQGETAAAAAASVSRGTPRATPGGTPGQGPGVEALRADLDGLRSELAASRIEQARLAETVARLQGSVQALLARGRPTGAPAAVVSAELRAKIERAVDARTLRQREGDGFTTSEAAFRGMFRDVLTAEALTGNLATLNDWLKDADALDARERERAEAPARLEAARARLEAERKAVFERLDREDEAGERARRERLAAQGGAK